MVQLECLESSAGCPFTTQDLEFEQAERMLFHHMDRKHPTGPCDFIGSARETDLTASKGIICGDTKVKKDDESNTHFIKVSGLVWDATESDLRKFFNDCQVTSVTIVMDQSGRSSGNAALELKTREDLVKALSHDRQYIGKRFVVIKEIGKDAFGKLTRQEQ